MLCITEGGQGKPHGGADICAQASSGEVNVSIIVKRMIQIPGSSRCEGPEVEMSMTCSRTVEKSAWLKQSE